MNQKNIGSKGRPIVGRGIVGRSNGNCRLFKTAQICGDSKNKAEQVNSENVKNGHEIDDCLVALTPQQCSFAGLPEPVISVDQHMRRNGSANKRASIKFNGRLHVFFKYYIKRG